MTVPPDPMFAAASSAKTRMRSRSPRLQAVEVGVAVKLTATAVVVSSVVRAVLTIWVMASVAPSIFSMTTLIEALTLVADSRAQRLSVIVPAMVKSAERGSLIHSIGSNDVA